MPGKSADMASERLAAPTRSIRAPAPVASARARNRPTAPSNQRRRRCLPEELEARLFDEREFNVAVASCVPDALIRVNEDGRVAHLNAAAERILGVSDARARQQRAARPDAHVRPGNGPAGDTVDV